VRSNLLKNLIFAEVNFSDPIEWTKMTIETFGNKT